MNKYFWIFDYIFFGFYFTKFKFFMDISILGLAGQNFYI
jgi:hypothetical protein